MKKVIADDVMIRPLTVRFRSTVKVNEVMRRMGDGERERLATMDRWPERDEVIEGCKERMDRGPKRS
jgi:hypothetical protein